MSEREIIRKEGVPVAFKGAIVQYVRCGRKCDPQQYTPNKRPHGLKCRKPHHKRCRHD